MNTQEINSNIAKKLRLPQKQVAQVTASLAKILAREIMYSDEVVIHGLGRLERKAVKARSGFNPATRARIDIPAHEKIKFKLERSVKESINQPLKAQQEKEYREWLAAREAAKNQKTMVNWDKETTARAEPVVVKPAPVIVAQPAREKQRMEEPQASSKGSTEVSSIIKETVDHVQKRMFLVFGAILAGLIIIFALTMLMMFKSKGFYNYLKARVMMVNEENRLTYQEIDNLVAQRMKELELDITQTKDIFKNELYSMQDSSEQKIRNQVMSDVMSQLRRAPRPSGTTQGKPVIKIIKYTVRKGDNLWRISELKSKNPWNWVGIYETNGHKIKNPNLIYPGQVILIPIVIN